MGVPSNEGPNDARGPAASFKQLTAANWLAVDRTMVVLGLADDRDPARAEAREGWWVRTVLSVVLSDRVPARVRDLWAVAQGVFLYGWQFYPLCALANEQFHRVADAAVEIAYWSYGGPPSSGGTPALQRRINWLIKYGHIPKERRSRWEAINALRNLGSHPTMASIGTPHDTFASMKVLRDELDGLFAPLSADRIILAHEQGGARFDRRPSGEQHPYEWANQLQGALEHLWRASVASGAPDAETKAATLVIERVRDQILGLPATPIPPANG